MREIKFRALGVDDNWHYGTSLKPLGQYEINLASFFPNLHAGALLPETFSEYTGLKDKNGKEIYEGDIVQEYQMGFKDEEETEWALMPYDKPDVVTMERFPVYWLQREEFGYEGEDLKSPDDFKVIGNIYENKELLKERIQ